MLGPLFDTILVCTITGLIVIISGAYIENDLNGMSLTLEAFEDFSLVWGYSSYDNGFFVEISTFNLFLLWS